MTGNQPVTSGPESAIPDMVFIAAGPFMMGSNEEDNERPPHLVNLDGYFIDRYPVTVRAFSEFVAATGLPPPPSWRGGTPERSRLDHPVVDVSWHDAVAYATWAGKRLPTEAEWEKAASWDPVAQVKRRWPWGNGWKRGHANAGGGIVGALLHQGTSHVGRYSPDGDSSYGLADMAGNVWEWCSSLFLMYPYSEQSEPASLQAAGSRVLRGGSWGSPPEQCRCAFRMALPPGWILDGVYGFRCALSEGHQISDPS